MILLLEMFKKHPHNQCFLVRGACFYHEKVRTLNYKGVRTGILCGFEFYRTAIIGIIQQETSISVSEKGVEAAAATANVPKIDAGETTPPDTVYMKLERPFFYTIRETSTNTPLFIGYQGSVK